MAASLPITFPSIRISVPPTTHTASPPTTNPATPTAPVTASGTSSLVDPAIDPNANPVVGTAQPPQTATPARGTYEADLKRTTDSLNAALSAGRYKEAAHWRTLLEQLKANPGSAATDFVERAGSTNVTPIKTGPGGVGGPGGGTSLRYSGPLTGGAQAQANAQYQSIVEQQKKLADQQTEALMAAQRQREELAQQYATREEDLASHLEGLGDAQRRTIEQRRDQLLGGTAQDLISRGLYGSTVLDSARRGIEQGSAEQMRQLEEGLTREKIGYLSSLSGERLQALGESIDFATDVAGQSFAMGSTPMQLQLELQKLASAERQAELDRRMDLMLDQKNDALGYAKLAEQTRQFNQSQSLAKQQMQYEARLQNRQMLQEQQMMAAQMGNARYQQRVSRAPSWMVGGSGVSYGSAYR